MLKKLSQTTVMAIITETTETINYCMVFISICGKPASSLLMEYAQVLDQCSLYLYVLLINDKQVNTTHCCMFIEIYIRVYCNSVAIKYLWPIYGKVQRISRPSEYRTSMMYPLKYFVNNFLPLRQSCNTIVMNNSLMK